VLNDEGGEYVNPSSRMLSRKESKHHKSIEVNYTPIVMNDDDFYNSGNILKKTTERQKYGATSIQRRQNMNDE